jgi:hypothetical protein
MRATAATGVRVVPMLALCAMLAMALGLGALGVVAEANGHQATISKKKKCKAKPQKCAPPAYHLSASGTDDVRSIYMETWSAEVELVRRSGIFGLPSDKNYVFYVQESGTVTLGFTGDPDCGYPGGTIDVPMQTVPVYPVDEPKESDFVISFDLGDKSYGGQTGYRYGTIFASGTETCPTEEGGTETTPVTYAHIGSYLQPSRGKVGGSYTGSWSYEESDTSGHFVQWKLTPKK